MFGAEGTRLGEIGHRLRVGSALVFATGVGDHAGIAAETDALFSATCGGGADGTHAVATGGGTLHDAHPKREGNGTAVSFVGDGGRAVETHPDSGSEVGGKAAEPRIFIGIGGAGFAAGRGGEAETLHTTGGAAGFRNLLKDGRDGVGSARGEHTANGGGVAPEYVPVCIRNTVDDIRRGAHTAVCKHGVGGGYLQRRGFPSAQVDSRTGLLGSFWEPRHEGGIDDIVETCPVTDTDRHGVAALEEPPSGGVGSGETTVGVAGRPAASTRDFAGAESVIGHEALRATSALKESGVNDGFEDGADLTAGLDSAVEGGFGAVAPAHHSEEGTRGVINDHACRLDVLRAHFVGFFRGESGDGSAELGAGLVRPTALLFKHIHQAGVELAHHIVLQVNIEGGTDDEPAGVSGVLLHMPLGGVEHIQDVVDFTADEVEGVILRATEGRAGSHDRFVESGAVLVAGNMPVVDEKLKDLVALDFCGGGVTQGGELIGAADDTGEECGFADGQVSGLLIEVTLSGLLESQKRVPPENAIDVAGEDGLLVVSGLDAASESHFGQLGVHVAHAVVVCIFRELHGESGRTLGGTVVLEDLGDGTEDTARVDAAVLPERAVLLHDEGMDEVGRYLGIQIVDTAAVFAVKGADFVALAVEDDGTLRHAQDLGDVVAFGFDAVDDGEDCRKDEADEGDADEDAEDLGQSAGKEEDEAERQGDEQTEGLPHAHVLLGGTAKVV